MDPERGAAAKCPAAQRAIGNTLEAPFLPAVPSPRCSARLSYAFDCHGTMTNPNFEVRGDWRLTHLPADPAPWMVPGRTYGIVLRRRSPLALPEAVVLDRETGAELGIYSGRRARELFATATWPQRL
jgi:hypothetical protein